eukprot:TRINITY_DN36129_c0_g1_i1.p1 TRINITY_DN36129_c0_g1~~TRINITY_DN36129_c0_g1_i1.p1  ORF type:complete len:456 (+),score=96.26 TRINITY_DN36129_c0_g1_i1:41-1369(+)
MAVERVHALDWVRGVLIFFVVYAHTAQSIGGLRSGGGDEAHVSVARPWCIPMLFWVSGAAASLSRDGLRLRPLLMLLAVGLLSNYVLWLAGPMDPDCGPLEPCTGRGLIFDFTIAPHSGRLFPVLYQMWYVAALILFAAVSRTFEQHFRRSDVSVWSVAVQWGSSCAVIALLCAASHQDSRTFATLALGEGMFVLLCVCGGGFDDVARRLFVYVAAVCAAVQFASPTIRGAEGGDVGAGLVLWFFVFRQHYVIGMLCWAGGIRTRAPPVLSAVWPVTALVGVAVLTPPSTYAPGGALAFPYPSSAGDRLWYLFSGFAAAIGCDRMCRSVPCVRMPVFLRSVALATYLFHPWAVSAVCTAGAASSAPHNVDPTLFVAAVATLLCAAPVAAKSLISYRPTRAATPVAAVIDTWPRYQPEDDGEDYLTAPPQPMPSAPPLPYQTA